MNRNPPETRWVPLRQVAVAVAALILDERDGRRALRAPAATPFGSQATLAVKSAGGFEAGAPRAGSR